MNIWCISKYAALPEYGAGARLFYLANEFQKQGNKTILITSDANHLASFPKTNKRYNYENIDGLDVIWIKTKKYIRTASVARIISWFDFEFKLFFLKRKKLVKPDVVLVSSLSIFSIFYGWYLKKKYRAKLVFEIRDIWPLTMTEEGGFKKWHPLVKFIGFIEKFGYKKSDLIVGTMPRLDLHVRNILGINKPVFCSPLGFDENRFLESTSIRLEEFENLISESTVVIGYAGSMGTTNNLEPFINCIESLKHETNIQFILIGGGDLKKVYESRLEAQKNVVFGPKIPSIEVNAFLQLCDILYLSTHDSDVWTFGQSMNKVVEYMLASRPIIASYSGFPTMLNESGAGVFVPSDNENALREALLHYINLSDAERKKIGEKGKLWILEERNYKYLASQYLEELDKQFLESGE